MAPAEPSDQELLAEMRRVRSDLGFRKWVGTRVKIVVALVCFDLIISAISIGAILTVRHVQLEACHRDNALRRAYITQWQPILDAAKVRDDPTSRATVAQFSIAFESFREHPC